MICPMHGGEHMERYPIILDDENAGQIRIVYVRRDAADRERLRAWYDSLDCDCVEHVRTMIPGIALLVDESGKMKDPQKPLNSKASRLYPGTFYGDPIVGHAIICSIGYRNGEPDIVPPTDDALRKLSRLTGWKIPGLPMFEDDL